MKKYFQKDFPTLYGYKRSLLKYKYNKCKKCTKYITFSLQKVKLIAKPILRLMDMVIMIVITLSCSGCLPVHVFRVVVIYTILKYHCFNWYWQLCNYGSYMLNTSCWRGKFFQCGNTIPPNYAYPAEDKSAGYVS